jgi:hypothetical protein
LNIPALLVKTGYFRTFGITQKWQSALALEGLMFPEGGSPLKIQPGKQLQRFECSLGYSTTIWVRFPRHMHRNSLEFGLEQHLGHPVHAGQTSRTGGIIAFTIAYVAGTNLKPLFSPVPEIQSFIAYKFGPTCSRIEQREQDRAVLLKPQGIDVSFLALRKN